MITVEQRCTTRILIKFKDPTTNQLLSNGELSGSEFACNVRKSVDYPTVLFSPIVDTDTLDLGYVYVTISPENTELMKVGTQYVLDVLTKLPSGDVFKSLATAIIVMNPTVSKF